MADPSFGAPSPGGLSGCYTSRRALFSAFLGARRLGCNLTEVPPGGTQCPFHSHRVAEEMFLIQGGKGELRFVEHTCPLRKHHARNSPGSGLRRMFRAEAGVEYFDGEPTQPPAGDD